MAPGAHRPHSSTVRGCGRRISGYTSYSYLYRHTPPWPAMLIAFFAAFLLGPLPASASAERGRTVTFERDIQPILTRAGCNAGACHGKARGQNGFALSLLGFDADFDFDAIVKDARGRRLFAANQEYSLFLRKASGEVPHGGGKR